MIKNIYFILILLSFNITHGCAYETSDIVSIGDKHTFYSEVLNEERNYWVHLPARYDANKKYSVVYLLDGNSHFSYTSAILDKLSSTKGLKQVILVAILNTDRYRDFTHTHVDGFINGVDGTNTGGSEAFLRFLTDEFIPHIEKEYPVDNNRVLIGHSLAGLFAFYSAIEAPEFFQGYVAIDPSLWWDDFKIIEQYKKNINTSDSSIYISTANNPYSAQIKPFVDDFINVLDTRKTTTFDMKYQYFDDESHQSVPLPSIYYGLQFIFDGSRS